MKLILSRNDDTIFAKRVIAISHHYSTMKDLAKELGVSAFTLRYRLGKARKLDEVKEALKRTKYFTGEVIK